MMHEKHKEGHGLYVNDICHTLETKLKAVKKNAASSSTNDRFICARFLKFRGCMLDVMTWL